MAANPINRDILRTALERPLEVAPGKLYEVSADGREALFVAFVVERWLQGAPQGPIEFAGEEAEAAVAALVEGWSATVIHMLAPGPRTFGELHRAVDSLSRRGLRRNLANMRQLGQVEVRLRSAGDAAYAPTDWLRAGIAALAASARAERRDPKEGMAPIDALDVEAAFLLTLPLLELPQELSGSCRFGVNLKADATGSTREAGPGMAGVTVQVDQGQVVSCVPNLDLRADTWGAGTATEWLDTLIEPDAKQVRTGGDKWLAGALLDALHQSLFGIPTH